MIKNVKSGDRIKYMSAAGKIYGEVVGISLARNALDELIPWLTIAYHVGNDQRLTHLAGTEDNLTMMQFEVLFRDAA